MASDDAQPIIIKRKKGGHEGHHGGAWKVAFADFMTAMMCFFLVMWLVGQKPDVREAVAGYFRDPGKFLQEGRSGVLKGNDKTPFKSERQSIGVRKAAIDKESLPAPAQQEQQEMAIAARNIIKELEKQEAFGRLKNNIKIQLTSEGLRIELFESDKAPAFFESGSAKLLQKSAVVLMVIAKELGRLRNRLVIEGHTDAVGTGDPTYTNWELSADRANAARELMDVSGLYDGQVREVRGYADKFPMIFDNPADPRNRRITILVVYQNRETSIDQVQVDADLFGGQG